MLLSRGLSLVVLGCVLLGCERQSEPRPEPAPARGTLRLLVVSGLSGELGPCGCGAKRLGGVDRLAALVRAAREEATSTLLLSTGDLFAAPERDASIQTEWQAETLADVLRGLGLTAAAPGANDLALGHDRLQALAERAHTRWLGVGLVLAEPLSATYLHRAGTRSIGVAGATLPPSAGSSGGVSSPEATGAALAAAASELRRQGADLVIGLVSGAVTSSTVDVLIGEGEPSISTSGTTLRLAAGHGGERLLVVDLDSHAAGTPWSAREYRAEVRELTPEAPRDASVRELMDRHFERVNRHNRVALADLEPPPVEPGQPGYVGSEPCAACHTAAYLWWKRTPHARAYATLEQRNKHFNLDCVGCHVTGYGQPGGAAVARVGALENVGCESCHGPGGHHVEDSRRPVTNIRREPSPETCAECHDREHSPGFDYASWRRRLLVTGHGRRRDVRE